MRVKLKTDRAEFPPDGPPLLRRAGDELDLDDLVGELLLERGIAERVEDPGPAKPSAGKATRTVGAGKETR